MHQLTERGVSIIFITHKLKEVLAVADHITVMRRGKVVGTTTPQESDEHQLAAMMVGREVLLSVEKGTASPSEVVLDVENLSVKDERDVTVVQQVAFEVRAGEVLGIAGVQGNGQTELVESLTGLREVQDGTITLAGQKVPSLNPRALVEMGMAHVPEDRHKHGLVLPYSISDNTVLNTYYQPPFARGLQRNQNAVLENAEGRPVSLLVANQPTRGLDVGSIEYIHRQIIDMRDKGVAVLLISAELDEIMSISDRIVVMFQGQIVATMDAADATREDLGLLMAGSGDTESGEDAREVAESPVMDS
jgi:simple sugar transport system ATP-binding protein